jgi:hypothetical protein
MEKYILLIEWCISEKLVDIFSPNDNLSHIYSGLYNLALERSILQYFWTGWSYKRVIICSIHINNGLPFLVVE